MPNFFIFKFVYVMLTFQADANKTEIIAFSKRKTKPMWSNHPIFMKVIDIFLKQLCICILLLYQLCYIGKYWHWQTFNMTHKTSIEPKKDSTCKCVNINTYGNKKIISQSKLCFLIKIFLHVREESFWGRKYDYLKNVDLP